VDDENNKHSSVSNTYEIDQRAIKVFLDWLPDNWLPRKQDPDFFVDYLVEIVDQGESTGLHFAAQVKGFEDEPNGRTQLSYRFKTKHLKYYLHRSQHPVFLFLINATTREGFWFFAQKHLKENVSSKILDDQQSLTIHFSAEDNLLNSTKFKCLLPEAESYVRDLHPGSVQAALQKRKLELESKDPRCSVSISIQDGKEHIVVNPKEDFSFNFRVRKPNTEDWRDFFERGTKLELSPGDFETEGAPLLENLAKASGDNIAIQFGTTHPASVHFVCVTESGTKTIPVDGHMRAGTKFLTFEGGLPNSPLKIDFEVSLEAVQKAEAFQSKIRFSPSKWAGQHILLLNHFDQIKTFAESFLSPVNPKAEIYVRGNSVVNCDLSGGITKTIRQMLNSIEWFRKCRWLSNYYHINPILPALNKLTKDQMEDVDVLYGLLSQPEYVSPAPFVKAAFTTEIVPSENDVKGYDNILTDGLLNFTLLEKTVDFFGMPVRVGAIRCQLTGMKLFSKSAMQDGKVELAFEGTQESKQISKFLIS
jgi:Domain of unknown function (DUF4365)